MIESTDQEGLPGKVRRARAGPGRVPRFAVTTRLSPRGAGGRADHRPCVGFPAANHPPHIHQIEEPWRQCCVRG